MADTLGGDFINTILTGDAGVTALVAASAIYNARMVPETEESQITINFYPAGTYDARLEYFSVPWSIDCRAVTDGDSRDLAVAVRDAINRVKSVVGGFTYFGTVQLGGTIPPADQSDVYNTPVTLLVRRK